MTDKFSSKRPLTDAEEAEIQRQIAADPDDCDVTDEQIAQARPFAEVFPQMGTGTPRPTIGDVGRR